MASWGHRNASESGAQNRRIAFALFVSLLLHAPLLLPRGDGWQIGGLDKAMPTLQVTLEPRKGDEATDNPPGQAETPPENLVAIDVHPTEAPTSPDVFEANDAPQSHDAAQSVDSSLTNEVTEPINAPTDGAERLADAETRREMIDSPAPGDEPATPDPVVADAATGDAAGEPIALEAELAGELDAAARPIVVTVAPAQERVLTRRLEREAHELLSSNSTERQVTFRDDHRSFTAVLTRQPATDGTGLERVTAEIITDEGGDRVHTRMQMKRLAFSHFTHFVNRWDPWVQLHDDEIAGRFHSNTGIKLAYDRKVAPRLLGKVSASGGIQIDAAKWSWRPSSTIFVGGLATRTPRIRLPKVAVPLAADEAGANADVFLVHTNTRIVFHADGTYECIDLATRSGERRRLTPGKPTYIIGQGETALYLRGVVNGNVTVYSPQLLVVQGNLAYPQGVDAYLGLVSDGNVEVDRADVTGPGDLQINAAVYARDRFIVRGARAPGPATLLVHGSLTVGSITETEPRYATRIEFDPRFEKVRPPGFPETDRYEVESWDGSWRIAEGPTDH